MTLFLSGWGTATSEEQEVKDKLSQSWGNELKLQSNSKEYKKKNILQLKYLYELYSQKSIQNRICFSMILKKDFELCNLEENYDPSEYPKIISYKLYRIEFSK